MKILAILNISNKEDIHCDSGYIFQCILADWFMSHGHTYVVAASDCKEFRYDRRLKAKKRYIKLGNNKYSSRFDFDSDQILNLIQKEKPDLIFNTQAELTSHIRSVLTWNKTNIPLVTYCHYPALWANNIKSPIPETDESLNAGNLGKSILFDILCALQTSDLFIIQSKFAKGLIERAAQYHKIKYDKRKFIVIAPPADPMFLSDTNPYNPRNTDTFVYNHRLYKTYGTEDFIEIFHRIYQQFAIPCTVFDPMKNRSLQRAAQNNTPAAYRQQMSQDNAFIISDNNKTRETYKDSINNSIACFAPLRRTCVWSMACMDCMGLGIPVIAPYMAAFPEFVPKQLLYKNEKTLHKILHSLLNDIKFRKSASDACFRSAHRFSAQNIGAKLESYFETLVKNTCVE